MTKTVLITGTSSGLGRSCAEYFAEQEYNVVATMRNPSCEVGQALAKLSQVEVIALDVNDEASIKNGVQWALEKFNTIDVLVNNAGFALGGPLELATKEQIELQYQTNVLGPICLMQAVIPSMRKARSGVIINVSSIAGKVAMPLNSMYIGTKFALEGISESAAIELAPFGIKVRTVLPGAIRTNFVSGIVQAKSDSVDVYDNMSSNMGQKFSDLLAAGSDASEIAKIVYEAATFEGDKLRFIAGNDAEKMMEMRNNLTDEEFIAATSANFGITL